MPKGWWLNYIIVSYSSSVPTFSQEVVRIFPNNPNWEFQKRPILIKQWEQVDQKALLRLSTSILNDHRDTISQSRLRRNHSINNLASSTNKMQGRQSQNQREKTHATQKDEKPINPSQLWTCNRFRFKQLAKKRGDGTIGEMRILLRYLMTVKILFC